MQGGFPLLELGMNEKDRREIGEALKGGCFFGLEKDFGEVGLFPIWF